MVDMATRVFQVEKNKPRPAYEHDGSSSKVSPLYVDRELYQSIAQADRVLVDKFQIDPRTAKAWNVPQGYICRLTTPEGPQVGDLNIWSAANPRERFWASRTRQLYRSHLTTFDRMWSTLPYLRPLCTIIGDSLADYGQDKWGGRVHDLLGTRCDPYVDALLSGEQCDVHCHSNLVRAVDAYGLSEFDVHDVLNVFQVTGLDEEGRYFMETSPAKQQDYFEYFAEIDLLCALSACPGGDLSKWGWGASNDEMIDCCRPLGVEIYKLVPGVPDSWKAPEYAPYRGNHGMNSSL